MKTRVQARTDIALIGAWDSSRNDSVLAKMWGKKQSQILGEEMVAGRLFLIRTGADGGGPIDVYLDTNLPEDIRKDFVAADGEYLLSVPTGKLVIAGVENYRTGKEANANSVIEIPAGDYSLRCLVAREETTGLNPPIRTELEQAVGTAD